MRLLPLLLLLSSCQWLDESRMPCEADEDCFEGWFCGAGDGFCTQKAGDDDDSAGDDDDTPDDPACSRPLELIPSLRNTLDFAVPGSHPGWVPDDGPQACRVVEYQEYVATTIVTREAWTWTERGVFGSWWRDLDDDGTREFEWIAAHNLDGRLEAVTSFTNGFEDAQSLHFEWDSKGRAASRKYRPSGIGFTWTWAGDELWSEEYDQLASSGDRQVQFFECDEEGWSHIVDWFHTEVVDEVNYRRVVARYEPEDRLVLYREDEAPPEEPRDGRFDLSVVYEYEGDLLSRAMVDSDQDGAADEVTRYTYDDSDRLVFTESDRDGDDFFEFRTRRVYGDEGNYQEDEEVWNGSIPGWQAYTIRIHGPDGRPLSLWDGNGATTWEYNDEGYPTAVARDVDQDGVGDVFYIRTWECGL